MEDRDNFIHKMIKDLDVMITSIEDREAEEIGFIEVREIAEQMRDELDALQ